MPNPYDTTTICPACGYAGTPLQMFEVPGRKDFGRILHVATAKEVQVVKAKHVSRIHSLCGRDFVVGDIYGGVPGIRDYDRDRRGLCVSCRRQAESLAGRVVYEEDGE